MKAILTTIIILFVYFPVSAQLYKGQWLAGGHAGFESLKYEDNLIHYKNTAFTFSPGAGYFLINNLAGGIRLNFQSTRFSNTQGIQSYKSMSISPFIRYYFLKPEKPFNILLDLGYQNTTNKYRFNTIPDYTSQKSSGYSIAAGPAIFLANNIALEFLLGYKTDKLKGRETTTNTLYSSIGFQVHLGNRRKLKL